MPMKRVAAVAVLAALVASCLTSCTVGDDINATRIRSALNGLPGVQKVEANADLEPVMQSRLDAHVVMEPGATREDYVGMIEVWSEHDAGGKLDSSNGLWVYTDGNERADGEWLSIVAGISVETAMYEVGRWRDLAARYPDREVSMSIDIEDEDPAGSGNWVPAATVRMLSTSVEAEYAEIVTYVNDQVVNAPAEAARINALDINARLPIPGVGWFDLPLPAEYAAIIETLGSTMSRLALPEEAATLDANYLAPLHQADGSPSVSPLVLRIELGAPNPADDPNLPQTETWPVMLEHAAAIPASAEHVDLMIHGATLLTDACAADPAHPISAQLWSDWRARVGPPPAGTCP